MASFDPNNNKKFQNFAPNFNKDNSDDLGNLKEKINEALGKLLDSSRPEDILRFLQALSSDFSSTVVDLFPLFQKLNHLLSAFQKAALLLSRIRITEMNTEKFYSVVNPVESPIPKSKEILAYPPVVT